MAIKTTPRDISVHADPLSFNAGIRILSGSPVQTYSRNEGEYIPDRSVLPCVLMPNFVSYDPEGVVNGERTITSAKWYEGPPQSDDSNLIVSGSNGYVIGDTGYPTYSLKVAKNFDAVQPVTIYCIFTVADTRVNKNMTIERSVEFYTNLVQGDRPSLRLVDQPKTWVVDPLKVTADDQGRWLQTITAQLYLGEEPADDANSLYRWQKWSRSSGAWVDFTEDELSLLVVSGVDDSGNWSKSIQIDARFTEGDAFRCTAQYYEGTAPESFDDTAQRVSTSMMVKMPESLRVNIRQLAGAKINAAMSTKVSFDCVITANNAPIAEDRYGLFVVEWYGKSGKSGVSDKLIGVSKTISFAPKTLGFDNNYSMSVYAKVKCYRITAVITDNDVWVVDESGSAVVSNVCE